MPKNQNRPEPIVKIGDRHSQTLLWRYNKELYRFIASRCRQCGKVQFPRRQVCAYCSSKDLEETTLSHFGKIIFAELSVYGAMRGFEDLQPQVIATIQLEDNGPLVDGEIVDVPLNLTREAANAKGWDFWDNLKGKRVRMVFRRMRKVDNGNLAYGYKFKIENPPWGK